MSNIPDEIKEKIDEKFPVSRDWNYKDTSAIQRHAARYGYSLASTQLANKDKEISELKLGIAYWEGKCNSLTMDNMTHEYNQAESEKFAPEYKRQIEEPLLDKIEELKHDLYLMTMQKELGDDAIEELKKELEEYKKCPKWYTRNDFYEYLRNNNYSERVANELSEMFFNSVQRSFRKGWEKGYNDFNPEKSSSNYKYYSEFESEQIKKLREGLEALVFTASKLWDDVKPIKDTDIMKATHPTIEEAKQLLTKQQKEDEV